MNDLLHRLCYKTLPRPDLQWDPRTGTIQSPLAPGHTLTVTFLDTHEPGQPLRITEIRQTTPRWFVAPFVRLWHKFIA